MLVKLCIIFFLCIATVKADVCSFFKQLHETKQVNSFINKNQKKHEIAISGENCPDRSFNCWSYEFPLSKDSKLKWITQRVGTANCQMDYYLLNDETIARKDILKNKMMPVCGETDCCGNYGHDFFTYDKQLYNLSFYDNKIYKVTENQPIQKLCSHEVIPQNPIEYKNYDIVNCKNELICNYLLKNLKNQNYNFFDVFSGEEKVEDAINFIEKDERNFDWQSTLYKSMIQCKSIDFNNDNNFDAVCETINGPPRFLGEITFFININNEVQLLREYLYQNSYIKKGFPENFYPAYAGKRSNNKKYPSNIFFMLHNQLTYTVSFNEKSNFLSFDIFLWVDKEVEFIGSIETEKENPKVSLIRY